MISMDGFINNEGFRVLEHPLLPYPGTTDVYNINTKELVLVESEREIHCIQIGKMLYVSKELYEKMRKL